jgi:hypothetical protein
VDQCLGVVGLPGEPKRVEMDHRLQSLPCQWASGGSASDIPDGFRFQIDDPAVQDRERKVAARRLWGGRRRWSVTVSRAQGLARISTRWHM